MAQDGEKRPRKKEEDRRQSQGEGGKRKRADGRWERTLDLGWKDGKRQVKYFYGKTLAEANRKRSAAIKALEDGGTASPSGEKLGTFLLRWLTDVKARRISRSTLDDYQSKARLHIIPALGQIPLRELTALHVEAFFTQLGKTHKDATVKKCYTILNSALRQARRWRMVTYNVVAEGVDAPTVARYEAATLTIPEAGRFLMAVEADRLAALWELAILTGARKGELTGLRWEDLDLGAGIVHIRHSLNTRFKGWTLDPPKTADSRRDLPLPPDMVDSLRRHHARQAEERLAVGPVWQDLGFVFTSSIGTPLHRSNLTRTFHAMCDRAGVPRMRIHDIRHTVGTLMRALKVDLKDISELLGHSGVGITGDLYVHPVPMQLVEAVTKLQKLLWAAREAAKEDA